jgi:hypothetical protein
MLGGSTRCYEISSAGRITVANEQYLLLGENNRACGYSMGRHLVLPNDQKLSL